MGSCVTLCDPSNVNQRWMTYPSPEYESFSYILMHVHAFSCIIITYMFIHDEIAWCIPHPFIPVHSLWDSLMQCQFILMHVVECKSAWNDHHPTYSPWMWVVLNHSQSFSCIPIHYHVCRIVQLNLEWPTPPLNMSHSHAFSCMSMHAHSLTSHTCSFIIDCINEFS